MDRTLSDLPEDIIHLIFSFVDDLTNKKALQLGLKLSKYLLAVLQSRPKLVFDIRRDLHNQSWDLHDSRWLGRSKKLHNIENARKELNYVFSMMNRENVPLDTLILYVESNSDLYDRCIKLAIKKGVKKLYIDMFPSRDRFPYNVLPVFEAESLVEFGSYGWCCLKPTRRVVWPNLKRLYIDPYRPVEMEDFETMIQGCPSLEHLKAHCGFTGGGNVKVANMHNLKELDIHLPDGKCLEVNNTTPNLESIQCSWIYVYPNLKQDYGTNKIGFGGTEYPNLKSLNVYRGTMDDERFFTNFSSMFPILETLVFDHSGLPEKITISSTSLKEIKLVDALRVDSVPGLQEASFDVPNLVHFEYVENRVKQGSILPRLYLAGSSHGWSSNIRLTLFHIDARFFLQLNAFLGALNVSETTIYVHFCCPVPKELSKEAAIESSIISLPWIRKFTARIDPDMRRRLLPVVDGILLICNPRIMTILDLPSGLLKRVYKKLISRNGDHHHHRDVASIGVSVEDDNLEKTKLSDGFQDWDTLIEEHDKMAREQPYTSFYLKYLPPDH